MNKWKWIYTGGKAKKYPKSSAKLAIFFKATGMVDRTTVSDFDAQFEKDNTYTKKMHLKKRIKHFSTLAVVLLLLSGVGYYFIGARKYDVTLSLNDGSGEEIVLSSNFGKHIEFPSDIDREGYHLVGWFTEDGEEWDFSEDRVLRDVKIVAKWAIDEFTIFYNHEGGECETLSQTANYEDELIMPLSQKKGYTFLGWSSDATSSTAEYAANTMISGSTLGKDGDIQLYAIYTINTYTVTCHANNGKENTIIHYTVNSNSLDIETPQFYIDKQYYEFEGWYNDETASTLFFNDLLDNPRDVDIYAKWKFNYDYQDIEGLREVHLSGNGGQTINVSNEKGVVIIGQSGKTYSGVNIVVEDGESPAHIVFRNVNITGSSTQSTIYSTSYRQIFIISDGSNNNINGANKQKAIYAPNATLYFVGASPLTVRGSDGENGVSATVAGGNGTDGADGTIAIISKNVIVNMSSTLSILGGNGGNGGNGYAGTDGASKAKPSKTQWSENGINGANGDNGRAGGSGGDGGDGAAAIKCECIIAFSKTSAKSGKAGNGGNGANGGNGGNGADGGDSWNFTNSTGGNGGDGGLGAVGGNGGNGGDVNKAIISNSKDLMFITSTYGVTGIGGLPGTGGRGGRGGNGGQGYNGAEFMNLADKKGNNGIGYLTKYAEDGRSGSPGIRR